MNRTRRNRAARGAAIAVSSIGCIAPASCGPVDGNAPAAGAAAPGPQQVAARATMADMRVAILRLTPTDVVPVAPVDTGDVLALVTDLDLDGETATVVCVADESTSLYLSTGGGLIGAGQGNRTIARETLAILAQTRPLLNSMNRVTEPPPRPGAGRARFTAVTPSGLRTIEFEIEGLVSPDHPFAVLFDHVNQVLTRLLELMSK